VTTSSVAPLPVPAHLQTTYFDPTFDGTPFGQTALMAAANLGHMACLQLLLAYPGIDVNRSDGKGNNALMYAIDTEKEETAFEVVSLLISKGIHEKTKPELQRTVKWG
jgi:hypothetical protein